MIRDSPSTLPKSPAKTGKIPALPDHFSFSSMQQFQMCPRKWFYGYLAKAPRERQPSALLFGASLHEALAHLHICRQKGRKADLATLESVFAAHWQKSAAEAEVCYGKTESKEELSRIARELFKLLLEAPPGQARILAVERPVRLKLPGLSVVVVGRADLILEIDGIIWLIDLKTSRNALAADQLAQGGAQLALYTAALRAEGARWLIPSRAKLLVLRKLKQPKLEAFEVNIGAASLERAKRMLSDTWRLLEAAASCGAFPTKPGWACTACPYRDRCLRDTSEGIQVPQGSGFKARSPQDRTDEKSQSKVSALLSALAGWFTR
ncbi:MAG: PD-(D/E)XK nuclease family protein [Planctomycetes bacterium]|nr:PD-(D/E)XK nuclease family protein [Planctomycetota bacterium]